MSNSDLISEISNPIRIKILFLLYEKNATLTELTKKIGNISNSEISRHLGRLASQNFVKKESIPGRKYEITSFGEIFIRIYKPLNFIFQYSEYFQKHRLNDISEDLIKKIHYLQNSELVKGTGIVMDKMKFLTDSVQNEIWIMIDNPFPFDWQTEKTHFIVPSSILKYESALKGEEGKFNAYLFDNLTISLCITDIGNGILFFPRSNENVPDYSKGFFIKDKKGIEYLRELWNYFLSISELYRKEF